MTDHTKVMAAMDVWVGGTRLRVYLRNLLLTLWRDGECFSGKRPFGNSGWQWDIYGALVKAGLLEGQINSYDEIEGDFDVRAADILVCDVIDALFGDG